MNCKENFLRKEHLHNFACVCSTWICTTLGDWVKTHLQVKGCVSCGSYNNGVLVQKDNHVTWKWNENNSMETKEFGDVHVCNWIYHTKLNQHTLTQNIQIRTNGSQIIILEKSPISKAKQKHYIDGHHLFCNRFQYSQTKTSDLPLHFTQKYQDIKTNTKSFYCFYPFKKLKIFFKTWPWGQVGSE